MAAQTKYVLTVDPSGAVVQVQHLGDDGSLSDVPVAEFFSQMTIPLGSFSGGGAIVVEPFERPPGDSRIIPQAPIMRQPPVPQTPPPTPHSPPDPDPDQP